MPKSVIQIGYKEYLLDAKDVITIMEMLDKADVWEEKWQSHEDGGTLYFAYPQESEGSIRNVKIIPDSLYKMAKLAGKPEK
jgi:hypothetical protein